MLPPEIYLLKLSFATIYHERITFQNVGIGRKFFEKFQRIGRFDEFNRQQRRQFAVFIFSFNDFFVCLEFWKNKNYFGFAGYLSFRFFGINVSISAGIGRSVRQLPEIAGHILVSPFYFYRLFRYFVFNFKPLDTAAQDVFAGITPDFDPVSKYSAGNILDFNGRFFWTYF